MSGQTRRRIRMQQSCSSRNHSSARTNRQETPECRPAAPYTRGVKALLLAITLLIWPVTAAPAAQETESSLPTHVVIITVDTLRADHLSCYGYDRNTSPNIDKLASEGVRFDRAYTTIPLTGPSHLSLFTSQFPQAHGAKNNGVAPSAKAHAVSFTQILRKHGYRAGAFISAWPLTSRLTHLNRWFDDYDEDLTRTYKLFNSSRYSEDVMPRAVRWLESNAGKRFFLWVHLFDPHEPYLRHDGFTPAPNGNPPAYGKLDPGMRDRIERYDSEIAYTDSYVGELLHKLDELKLRDSTLVILAADHGESLGEHNYVGHGRYVFREMVHVPLIFRLPGTIAPGRTIKERVSLLDVAPTVVDLVLGPGNAHPHEAFTGRSLALALAAGVPLPPHSVRYVAFSGEKLFFPQWLSWMWMPDQKLPLRIGQEDGTRKLIWNPADQTLDVFNVKQDPLEVHPREVAAGDPDYKRETVMLANWFKSTDVGMGQSSMSKRDVEVLRSLGYVQ